MNTEAQALFWRLYDSEARPAIERACRAASRSLSDGTMDADDMASWVHQRIWKMAESNAAPTFHDDPTPEQAIERIVRHARVLSRWAYLSLMRAHWRRSARQNAAHAELSRTERLAMVSRAETDLDRDEDLQAKLAEIKASASRQLRAKLAASWPETSERRRIALALGATDEADDALIDRTSSGEMKENTVQQMRSRAQRQIQAILKAAKRTAVFAFAAGMILASVPSQAQTTSAETFARVPGEQTGGRSGKTVPPLVAEGEQTGGRSGTVSNAPTARGEQTGGRGGTKNGRESPALAQRGEQTGGRKG